MDISLDAIYCLCSYEVANTMSKLICIQPISIQLIPIKGTISIRVDRQAVLDHPYAASMIAEVLRGIGAAQGKEILIYGGCIRDAMANSAPLEDDESFVFSIPH